MMNNPKPKTPGGEPPKERLSVDALKRLRNILAMAVDYAILMDRATLNRVRLTPIPTEATPDGRRGYIALDDVMRLLPAFVEHSEGAMIYLMIRAGLRYEEAAAVTVDAYNGADINIWKTVRRNFEPTDTPRFPGQKFETRLEIVESTKTKSSRRTVALPADVVEVLNAHLVRDAERIRTASGGSKSPLLFARPNGAPLSNSYANKRLKAICADLGVTAIDGHDSEGRPIPGPVSCHVLRHTMTTLTVDHGIDFQDLADVLGQRDPRMILNRYRHLDPNRPRTAAVKNDYLPTK
jgi:integrase